MSFIHPRTVLSLQLYLILPSSISNRNYFSKFRDSRRAMASHDQHYRAGEAHGRAEEGTEQTIGTMSDKAREAKDKTYEKTQEAKDKTSQKAHEAKQTAEEDGDTARQKAHEGKEKTKGVFQQTGEKVKHMAEGARDAVKHTFGMGPRDEGVLDPDVAAPRCDDPAYKKNVTSSYDDPALKHTTGHRDTK